MKCLFVDYMVEQLGIDKNKISELGNLLYKNYGTTMAGLRVCNMELWMDGSDFFFAIYSRY